MFFSLGVVQQSLCTSELAQHPSTLICIARLGSETTKVNKPRCRGAPLERLFGGHAQLWCSSPSGSLRGSQQLDTGLLHVGSFPLEEPGRLAMEAVHRS